MSTAARKPGRPRQAVLKTRQNITIHPAVLKKAKRMAFVEGLSLSTWIEQMLRERIDATANTTAP